jgi:hypothetical protein
MDLMSFLLKCSLIKFNVDVADGFDSVISEYFLLNFIPESFLRVQLWRVRGILLACGGRAGGDGLSAPSTADGRSVTLLRAPPCRPAALWNRPRSASGV